MTPIRLVPWTTVEGMNRPLVSAYPALRRLLLVLAFVCFVVFTAVSAGWFDSTVPNAWLGAGLTFVVASFF